MAAGRDVSLGLFESVVDGGYCVGCGACASMPGSGIGMELDPRGHLRAVRPTSSDVHDPAVLGVCPFSGHALDEDQLAAERFADHAAYHPRIGYHIGTYAGFVQAEDFRARGSSGGGVSWLACELMRRGLIDALIHIQPRTPSSDDRRLFCYAVSRDQAQVQAGAKSRYYPIELSQVMQEVRDHPGRYALVGIPCFVKAVRLLMKQDPELNERIRYCIGLVCGHLKTTRFAEYFGWQCGIHPSELTSVDFRLKIPGAAAFRYGVELRGVRNGEQLHVQRPVHEFRYMDWGVGLFKYSACDFCDDVLAETADVTFGDAWLPEYADDPEGTNVVVTRHPEIERIVSESIENGTLRATPIPADRVAKSQDAGLRHRREGLSYRLHLADQAGRWRPPKRVAPDRMKRNRRFRRIHDLRIKMRLASHEAFEQALAENDFERIPARMQPLVDAYARLYGRFRWRMVLGKFRRMLIGPPRRG